MSDSKAYVLTINGGSSSIKFAVFEVGEQPERGLSGAIERIGQPDTCLTYYDPADEQPPTSLPLPTAAATDYASAANFLVTWLEQQAIFSAIGAVGHRVVHGFEYSQPQQITQHLLAELHRISAYDPEHMPGELALITAFRNRHPQLPQFVCFDTAFHQAMPRVAQLLPLPRRFTERGLRRYGFHGLSYAYLVEELARVTRIEITVQGRVIMAHLGSGASMAAVLNGQSIETTMGLTPAGGLPMSTRSGDLDPGVASHLLLTEKLTAEEFNHLINHESGLLGVSGISADMSVLLTQQATDTRAAEAVALFCYQVRKMVGALAAVLGGVDTLVFSGGIGEHSAEVRARVCAGLDFLGITLDPARNAAHAPLISPENPHGTEGAQAAAHRVEVRVIPTDEERMIAQTVCRLWAPRIYPIPFD